MMDFDEIEAVPPRPRRGGRSKWIISRDKFLAQQRAKRLAREAAESVAELIEQAAVCECVAELGCIGEHCPACAELADDEGCMKPAGCCDACAGTGCIDEPATNGKCWDCYGSGHTHPPEQDC